MDIYICVCICVYNIYIYIYFLYLYLYGNAWGGSYRQDPRTLGCIVGSPASDLSGLDSEEGSVRALFKIARKASSNIF